jgi:LPS sulfotransferase NodH
VLHEEYWNEYFMESGIVPFTVVYEDLARSYEQTTFAVLNYLGIDTPDGLALPEPRLKKQADVLSEEWVRRYARSKMWHRRRRYLRAIPRSYIADGLRRRFAGTQAEWRR